MKYFFNSAASVLGTALTYLFGGCDMAIIALLVFMVLDYITGVIVAISEKNLSSETGFRGLAKKLFVIIMLIMAVFLDRLISDGNWIVRTLVAYFYIANEGISITENVAKLGVPIPAKIKGILEALKSNNKDN